MRARLNEWFNKYADEKVDGVKESVTGLGQMCRAGIYSEKTDTYYCEKQYDHSGRGENYGTDI